MPENSKPASSAYNHIVRCPRCGCYCQAQDVECPSCGEAMPTQPLTNRSNTAPPAPPRERPGIVQFDFGDTATLRVVDSSIRLDLPLMKSTVLGRKIIPESEELLDLSDFNAFQHGVSRRHCQLQRQGNRLIITDLGSSNGTFLNNERLLPYTNYVVAHGDQVTLGKLRLKILFNSAESDT
jgi:hypothetical protein